MLIGLTVCLVANGTVCSYFVYLSTHANQSQRYLGVDKVRLSTNLFIVISIATDYTGVRSVTVNESSG